jgi:hypothetical protein
MKKFFPYFEANNTRYTILRGMRIFLSQNNQVLAVQSANKVFSKPSQDPLLVRFWQNEIAREYGI